ncbi:dermonecrotic toxin domain-containing protein [Pseudomonas sp. NPDC089401]|uniref:dermonecrotic toxin domain-containing protein n=1 Tax=Pseudomonas sp. NPDC089401 TaxID=3364462 RepID=UPI00380C8DCA
MNDNRERMLRVLDALAEGNPMVRLVSELLHAYPDLYTLANEHAEAIVKKHTGKAMDPRFVWWHQFNLESTSHLTFTGWQHSGPPQKSLVLTELMIERFDLHFQEASDELDMCGGFYRQGPHARAYDERNEVPMLGSAVQRDLWALDFATLYRDKVERFWSAHDQSCLVLAKITLLGHGVRAAREGDISQADLTRLHALVADDLLPGQPPSLAQLRQTSSRSPLAVHRYVFSDGDRGCLFALQAEDGRVLAYMPWAGRTLKGFDSELALAGWLREHLKSPGILQAFVAGAHGNPGETSARALIKVHLQGIADSHSAQAAKVALTFFKRPLASDLFRFLCDQAASEMRSTALMMRDNSRLRRAMCSGYLSAFLAIAGGFAPLGWPMSLALLGASVAKVGLEADAAAHASDEQSRKHAMRTAMLESLYATLNLLDVGFQSTFASLAYEAPPHEIAFDVQRWQSAQSPLPSIEDLEINTLLAGEPGQSGLLRGVYVAQDGACSIVLDGLSYRVRYSQQLSVWLIVPADNPFAFAPLRPVRLNAAGEWELLQPLSLAGGAPSAERGLQSRTSLFWDTYAVVNANLSRRLSAKAMQRQKALLSDWPVAELQRGQAPDLDANGIDCVKVDGRAEYSYRYGREYFNSLIEYYTSDESRVNDVFRVGNYKYGDEDDFIGNLADSLDALPKSSTQRLYRGGHLSRGTGGQRYRDGRLQVGDVLVNTDLSSFTENPYLAAEFASQPSVHAPAGLPGVFDDSSVLFELRADHYQSGTPIGAFSLYWDEAETVFLPGNYFRVDQLEQITGNHYRFIHVTLSQTVKPASGTVYDLRTGQPFDIELYRARFRTPALVERFFPGL